MSINKVIECESKTLERWSKFQLSHHWKKKGIILSVLIFLTMISLKFIDSEPIWLKEVLKRGLLVGFLIISLSKEDIEDEMVSSLRLQSYALAFIFAVLYSLIQPAADYLVQQFIYEPSNDNTFSYFQVLFFMLLVQIMFFHVFKRYR